MISPFFDPGTSTSGLSSGVTFGGAASSLVQTTGEAAVMGEAGSKSATHPVEGPGTDVKQQNATQPVEAPGARTATQSVEAPGAGPDVLPTGTGSAALHAEFSGSDSEEELQCDPGLPIDGYIREGSCVFTSRVRPTSSKAYHLACPQHLWGSQWWPKRSN